MSDAPHKFDLHIGDYLRDTEDLSLLQHGTYLRLMLWYYSTAKPLPNDLDRIYRRIGATSREEKHATEHVLTEFFRLITGKWVHKRIEEELSKWNMATQKARNNAKLRWEKFRINNNEPDAMAMLSQCGGNANPDACRQPVAVSLLPSKDKVKREALIPPKNRGTRLNIASLPDNWIVYCKHRRPDLDPVETFRRFRDHFLAAPGKDGLKADWDAAWRNWVRREYKGTVKGLAL